MKQVTLIFTEGGMPNPGKEIWFSYFDENTEAWKTSKGLTDISGSVLFSVPVVISGESFTFATAESEARLAEAINALKSGKGWLVPPVGIRLRPDLNKTGATFKIDLKSKGMVAVDGFETHMPESLRDCKKLSCRWSTSPE